MNESSTHQQKPFKCMKCSHQEAKTGEFRAAGGFWSKLFNIQGEKFKTLMCTHCGFTEVYKRPSGAAENVLDFFVG